MAPGEDQPPAPPAQGGDPGHRAPALPGVQVHPDADHGHEVEPLPPPARLGQVGQAVVDPDDPPRRVPGPPGPAQFVGGLDRDDVVPPGGKIRGVRPGPRADVQQGTRGGGVRCGGGSDGGRAGAFPQREGPPCA